MKSLRGGRGVRQMGDFWVTFQNDEKSRFVLRDFPCTRWGGGVSKFFWVTFEWLWGRGGVQAEYLSDVIFLWPLIEGCSDLIFPETVFLLIFFLQSEKFFPQNWKNCCCWFMSSESSRAPWRRFILKGLSLEKIIFMHFWRSYEGTKNWIFVPW